MNLIEALTESVRELYGNDAAERISNYRPTARQLWLERENPADEGDWENRNGYVPPWRQ